MTNEPLPQRYSPLFTEPDNHSVRGARRVIGVWGGEGIGPEVIDAALSVLATVEAATSANYEIRRGGPIGLEAERRGGSAFSEEAAQFCDEVFTAGGAMLAGPGGGRFVYDLRRRFDLFCKLSPILADPSLADASHLKPAAVRGVDLIVVRENVAGVYQGDWSEHDTADGRVAEQKFSYSEPQVRRILEAAARIAAVRRGRLSIVIKTAAVPTVSRLWLDCAEDLASRHDVQCEPIDLDYAAYRMIQHASQMDVIVAPNLAGDVLSDLGGVLLGSRGLSYSGNFSANGAAVYQTNHGSAFDLVGTDRANPVAQISALAMLLHESFGHSRQAELIRSAVTQVWRQGWRTADLAAPGARIVGTRELTERIIECIAQPARSEP